MRGAAVQADVFLGEARAAVDDLGRRSAALLAGAADITITPAGSEWSVHDIAVHLVHCARLYAGMAAAPSPVTDLGELEAYCQRFIDESPEWNSDELAGLIDAAISELVEAVAQRSGSQPVVWHGGVPCTMAEMVAVLLGEYVLHGYDMATALGVPWPIDPAHAALVVRGYHPLLGLMVDPRTAAGHTATYAVELDGGASFTVRFINGQAEVADGGRGRVDSTLFADPIAYLLVVSERLSKAAAIALGLLRAGGPRPELALAYHDLFMYSDRSG